MIQHFYILKITEHINGMKLYIGIRNLYWWKFCIKLYICLL